MKRLILLVFGSVSLLFTPAIASAQFVRPFVGPFGLPPGAPVIVPSANPFFYLPRYTFTSTMRLSVPTVFGNTTLGFSRTFIGNSLPQVVNPFASYDPYAYGVNSLYLTGSPNTRTDVVASYQRSIARAQREVALATEKPQSAVQWNYDKNDNANATTPASEIAQPVDPMQIAIPLADHKMIVSGEANNGLLNEIARAESKRATGPSAYVPPLLFDQLRFSGTPAGDLFDLTRQAGSLDFPSVFDEKSLEGVRSNLEKDFAAVAVAVQAGRSPDHEKIAKLDTTFQRAQTATEPFIKSMSSGNAAAAHKFMNQMANAIQALKSGAGTGLIDPKWSTEGVTVGDLVKHMTRHKLQFGPAPQGGEEAYSTMHRNLATYLFVLNQPKK